jgi:hypothetical protein
MPETILDTFTTGLRTEEQPDRGPYGFRVTWIAWDSGFRGTELSPGDLVLAAAGVRYEPPASPSKLRAVGRPSEDDHLRKLGIAPEDGAPLVLQVKRGPRILDVAGRVRAERRYTTDAGRTALGPGGPESIARDGFDSSWSSWYEKLIETMRNILDGGWRSRMLYSRRALEQMRAEQPRIDYVMQHYPGPLADALREDWERVVTSLMGRRYELTDDDVAWRRLGEERIAEITAAGKAAREALLARLAPETIAPFPTIHPMQGDRAAVAGKIVELPKITGREMVSEAGLTWFTAGDQRSGYYFMDPRPPAAQRMFDAKFRYQMAIAPRVPEGYQIIARIAGDPTMLVMGDRAVPGLLVEPVGATIGERLFVDLTRVDARGESLYAGEEGLQRVERIAVPDDASPEQVMAAYYRTLEVSAFDVARTLFTTWHATRDGGRVRYDPSWAAPVSRLQSTWADGRKRMIEKVQAVRVVGAGEVSVLLAGNEFPGAPLLEEVDVEVDHIAQFDGEHRSFCEGFLCRVWWLQRRDGGPWRIAHQINTLGA